MAPNIPVGSQICSCSIWAPNPGVGWVAGFRVTSAFEGSSGHRSDLPSLLSPLWCAAATPCSVSIESAAGCLPSCLPTFIVTSSHPPAMFRATLIVLVLCVLGAIAFTPSASSRTSSRQVEDSSSTTSMLLIEHMHR